MALSGCGTCKRSPMGSIVPFKLFIRIINSGVDFTLRATFCKTSPGLTMYSSFSGDGVRERRMSTFTSPNKSLASSAWGLFGYFWIKAVRAARASGIFPSWRNLAASSNSGTVRSMRGSGVTSPRCSLRTWISSLKTKLYPNQAAPPKMIIARNRTKSHFMDQIARAGNFVAGAANFQPRCAEKSGRFLASREEAVPEPADGALFLIAPSVMAILAIKLLGNDFQRAEKPDQGRSHEFARHLRILDVRRSALRAADNGGGDIGVACLPFDH